MIDISPDLKVNEPTVTLVGTTFVSIENYQSILEYDVELIKIKTKLKIIKITGEALKLKYINEEEIGIKGKIFAVEYIY